MTTIMTVVMLGLVALVATETVVYWHVRTRGTWRDWPAGRSLMYLLLIISTGFTFGVVNRFLGEYPARGLVSFLLYAMFIGALVVIRFTIRAEMKRAGRPLVTKLPAGGDARDIVVASENTETE